ncbi:Uracil-DNA glycosylase [Mycoplasmopsis agalactiae 14628]|uniref:Uracil-DNA glycosylase n=1 Tax=Mycoplasmopsis agalactiae 14628 TaxID=1110504 RepID=I5D5D5_MYCAA|nr:uracil-DNA glycosylase [Mycoplasmopsis agalactiae]EIN14894.1 Uracil-DNA glycosylase [Mycoplasmopsis agalactiae 14628]
MKNKFAEFINKESQKPYFKGLIASIEKEKSKFNVFPSDERIFECLKYSSPEKLKLIIIGQDPYYKNGYADGLAFSTESQKCPKSLENILIELKKDYPEAVIETFSLKSWAKNHILLLNGVLTVSENKPNSHSNFGWKIFVSNLLDFILEQNKNVIFGAWGNKAYLLIKDKVEEERIIFTSHPSPLSYSKTKSSFKDSHFFKKVNAKLTNPIDFSIRKEN